MPLKKSNACFARCLRTSTSAWMILFLLFAYHENFACSQSTNILRYSVSENAPVGTEVGRLPSSEHSSFLLVEDYGLDHIDVESDGVIVITNEFDHEETSLYDFVVYDLTNSTYYQVQINVTDVNDNYPTFPSSSVTLIISEASQIGSKFDIGSATDRDSFPFNVRGYRIASGNSGDYFRVDSRYFNGFVFADLIVNRTLNREQVSSFFITIEAYDGGIPPKTGAIEVQVDVSDVNDNAPTFDFSRYTVAVSEGSPVGTDVITMTATDLDLGSNGEINYRIDRSNSDPDVYFVINPSTGVISLNKRLDYELATQHKIVVEALDTGNEPQIGSTVVIVTVVNINDNYPVFNVIFLNANESKVSEAAEVGDYLALVSVSDPDLSENSQINVTLTGGDGRFGLEPGSNATYFVVILEELNRETNLFFDITLTASDGESPPKTISESYTITVEDVNDNPPKFESDFYEVSLDNYGAGSYVTQIHATDADVGLNAEITYRLLSTNQSHWFGINPNSGLITTRQILNPTINSSPRLIVIATDKGEPPMSGQAVVVVNLVESDVGVLQFEQASYSFNVAENTLVGSCLQQVRVTDDDSTASLSYSIVSDDSSATSSNLPFEVRSDSGDVCVTSSLDRETVPSYQFDVQVSDGTSQTDLATVYITVIDINEHAPVFHPTAYFVNLERNASRGFPVTRLTATDADDYEYGQVSYTIVDGNNQGYFIIDEISGQLSVENSLENLDIGLTYDITISAVDERGLQSSQNALVVITLIEGGSLQERPFFSSSHYRFIISEDAPVASSVGSVEAVSSDGSTVVYEIRHDPPVTNWFLIDSTSGKVIVKTPMDREIFANLTFQVVALSGTPPLYSFASVTVTLGDINDNSPYFYGSVDGILPILTIPYNVEVDEVIETISSVDNDEGKNGTVTYYLFSPYFKINSTTGIVHLNAPLDQAPKDYNLVFESRDLGHPSRVTSASQVVRARQQDRNCPLLAQKSYQLHIPEDLPISTTLASIHVSALNPHARFLFHISGSGSVPFSIYSNGSLYLDQSVDYEVKEFYRFSVNIRGVPSSIEFDRFCHAVADVTITIDDVNDNAPLFTKSVYDFHVTEGLPFGSEVGTIFAFDQDSNTNARVTYRFALTNMNFELDPITGLITTLQPLNRIETSRFALVVEATDDVYLSQATVHIHVDDVNDNFPRFLSETLRYAVVLAGSEAGAWVADMTATDDDIGNNALLTYSIAGSSLFSVGSITGRVTTRSTISDNDLGIHILTVTATDHGVFPLSSSVTLRVNIRPSTSNPSQYSNTQFVFTPVEDSSIGMIIGSFRSTSPSRDVATSLPTYRAVTGSGLSFVRVNGSTGDVVLKKELNFNSSPELSISVEARTSSRVTLLNGQINIRDVNDHTPTFTSGTYFIGVDEDALFGREIWRFMATDNDSGLEGQVKYSLINQSPRPGFIINENTGALFVNASLDKETISEYVLVIKATDSSSTSRLFSTAACVITVRDVNDNAPQFTNRNFAYVMEDEPLSYPVTRFVAVDQDSGANGHVTYSLVSIGQDSSDIFHLDSNSGLLTLVKRLDYERKEAFNLNVSATDGAAGNPLSTYQNFVVYVINVNDLRPRFEKLIYHAEVVEEQSPGVVVTRVMAVDDDSGSNENVTYSLQPSSDSKDFNIDPVSGVITTTVSFDREVKDNYQLTVFSADNLSPPLYDYTTVNVTIIDINDHEPVFSPLDDTTDPATLIRLEIPENSTAPELIHVFAAFDLDSGENSRITYSIEDGNEDNDFFLNSTTGQFYTLRALDREKTASYRLTLVASDHGQPARSKIVHVIVTVLDVNDNNPRFTKSIYEVNVTESLSKGQYVVTVHATDRDEGRNGAIRYFLAPPTSTDQQSGLFDIDIDTGLITTGSELDREQEALYHFSVLAIDSSSYNPQTSTASVLVHVVDVNDNAPLFDESVLRIAVSRDLLPGAAVVRVSAHDDDQGSNSLITYSFSNSNISNSLFNIDSSTGVIQLVQQLSTTPSPYFFLVLATDQGNPQRSSEAVVIIDIDGEEPSGGFLKFDNSTYDVTIWENVQKNFPLIRLQASVSDAGSNTNVIEYRILFGNEVGGPFSISIDGVVTVSNPSLLDFETKPNIPLRIMASIPTTPTITPGFTTVNVHLRDENDNHPRCSQSQYHAQVMEEQAPSFLMQISAIDEDFGENEDFRFHIASGDPDNVFSIDSESGSLHTDRNLDREIHDHYELLIYVTDRGETRKTGTCTVLVDVLDLNDHDPNLVVPYDPIFISEDAVIGSLITTVTANDVDVNPTVTFSLSPSNERFDNFFSIDRYGGRIFLTSSLDFEAEQNLTLFVTASDGEKSDSAPIQIVITDVNDNKPTFDQAIYDIHLNESAPANTPVITLHTTDADSNDNGRVSYRIVNIIPNTTLFVINSDTGVISTNQDIVYTPHSSVFSVEVEAYDHGVPSQSQTVAVRIQILDINDNPPRFIAPSYTAQVNESASRGSYVTNVSATDDDFAKENTNLYFEIVAGNENDSFKITSFRGPGRTTVGTIQTAHTLDRESRDFYELVITAFDRGVPQLSSNVTVEIYVLNINDNSPRFNSSLYHGSVRENNEDNRATTPTPVLSVYATDPDGGALSSLDFSIISGNDDNAFELRHCLPSSPSCSRLFAKVIDYETTSQYRLTLQVADPRHPSHTSITQAVIDVENVNEYEPVVDSYIQFAIDEASPPGHTLFLIHASDQDAGDLGRITFNITNKGSRHIGENCPLPADFFIVEDVTGAVTSTHELDYENCRMLSFEVGVCDPDQCSSTFIELRVTPVDEFPPQFSGTDGLTGYHFSVPYLSPAGYVIGHVNATDRDADIDGRVLYSMHDSSGSDLFFINSASGIISLSRDLDTSMSHVIIVTAQSSNQRSSTHVTIDVTGAPAIAPEAQVLAIVFGIVAVLACVIVIILMVKHCRNKKAYKDSNSSIHSNDQYSVSNVKLDNRATSRKLHDISNNVMTTMNGLGVKKTTEKSDRENAAGDYKLKNLKSNNIENRKNVTKSHQDNATTALCNRYGDDVKLDKQPRHRKIGESTGNDESGEDEEVTRITSTSSSFESRSSSTSQPFTIQHRIADSGIQQDMDKASDRSDRFNVNKHIESNHLDISAGDSLNIAPPISSLLMDTQSGRGDEFAPVIKRALSSSKNPRANILAYLDSLEEHQHPESDKVASKIQSWKPEFEPLSSVFTEIARLREESTDPLSERNRCFSNVDTINPPPLLTSIPPQNDSLSTPVPLSQMSRSSDKLHHHSLHTHSRPSLLAKHQPPTAPPPYSYVMPSRPESGTSSRSRSSRSSQYSHHPVTSFPANFINTASYISSMSRAPNSYHSSLTSPAMSPSLSPSLTPLTTRSPPPIEGSRLQRDSNAPSLIKIIRGHSEDPTLSGVAKERMVHV